MKHLIFWSLIIFATRGYSFTEKEVLFKIKGFGKNLKQELQKGLKKNEIEALKICNLEAEKILEKHNAKDIKIGRVSLKDRNPQNTPKQWMKDYIEKFHSGKITKPYIVTNLSSEKKGLLKPIRTMPVCLKCHGSSISSSTLAEINKLYPDDKAVGYKVGEIRGFFWSEFSK